jgi:hypothetical protein
MRAALKLDDRPDSVLAYPETLSCGPISPDDPGVRASWWAPWYDEAETLARLSDFRAGLDAGDDITVWFSRNAADELAFFHACVARLANRPFDIAEIVRPAPKPGQTDAPIPRASTCQPETLVSLLSSARPISDVERSEAVARWSQLQSENAPFRIVSPEGLISAAIDVFDERLLSRIGPEPRSAREVVLETMLLGDPDYLQVGDVMLFARLEELAGRGELLVHGDPDDLWSAKVSRAPGSSPAL